MFGIAGAGGEKRIARLHVNHCFFVNKFWNPYLVLPRFTGSPLRVGIGNGC